MRIIYLYLVYLCLRALAYVCMAEFASVLECDFENGYFILMDRADTKRQKFYTTYVQYVTCAGFSLWECFALSRCPLVGGGNNSKMTGVDQRQAPGTCRFGTHVQFYVLYVHTRQTCRITAIGL